MKKKLPYAVFLLITLILSVFYETGPVFRHIDNVIYDMYQRRFPLKIENPSVVFIEIDQKSLDFLKKNALISWPWPRSMYAHLIDAIKASGAQNIIFDLLFSSSSMYGKADDSIFSSKIKSAKNVYLPFVSGSGTRIKEPPPGGIKLPSNSMAKCKKSDRGLFPLVDFLKRARRVGDARGFPDRDGIFRKYSLCTEIKGSVFPSLAFSIFPEDSFIKILGKYRHTTYLFPRFPRYRDFKRYSFIDVITLYREGKLKNAFRGKTVIVGATAPGLLDLRPTSVSKNTPGMFLHGAVIENTRLNAFINHPPLVVNLSVVLFVLAGFYLIYFLPFNLLWRSAFILIFTTVLIFSDLFLYSNVNTFISPVIFLFPLVFLYISFVSYDYTVENREKRFIKKLFMHYVSRELLEEILKSPQLVKIGGERKIITVMFSDIASFTSISEKLKPEEVVSILNRLLEDMSNIIMNEHGYIDKYEGDAIMAFWNAPVTVENHATCAIKAAIECHEKLKREINPSLEKLGFKPLNMRFGINTGEAVVGNIGSSKRFDYTAIGDSVNLASRLEGINKVYGTNIIISEYTKERAERESPSLFLFRELDYVRVKGKQKPVRIYEVTGFKEAVSAEKIRIIEQYEKALFYYRRGDFKKAKKILEKIAEGDSPSEVLLKRCLSLLKNPPTTWDGIFTMTTK